MSRDRHQVMAKQRALLTETERRQLVGAHGDDKRYQATSRVRRRLKEELPADVELLRVNRPNLFSELQDVVCDSIQDPEDIPNEYRVTCGECGYDGGTYDYFADPDPPAYCPKCGRAVDESDKINVVNSEKEPTALSWEDEY